MKLNCSSTAILPKCFRFLPAWLAEEKNNNESNDIDERLKKITGVVTLPDDFDVEKAKEEYHKEKYGVWKISFLTPMF